MCHSILYSWHYAWQVLRIACGFGVWLCLLNCSVMYIACMFHTWGGEVWLPGATTVYVLACCYDVLSQVVSVAINGNSQPVSQLLFGLL